MKKFTYIIALCTLFLIGFTACGPSQEEQLKQKRTEDSLNALDSDKSLDEANKLLQQADSIEKAKQDSMEMAAKKKSKIKS